MDKIELAEEIEILRISEKFLRMLESQMLIVATAESCTGGLLAAAFTEISGSSVMFDRGFITYSNEAKSDMLGVKDKTLKTHGAVSEETAKEMAEGALKNSRADITISITGIAGPSGGTEAKPVGLVYAAIALNDKAKERLNIENTVLKFNFKGDRSHIRRQTVKEILKFLTVQK